MQCSIIVFVFSSIKYQNDNFLTHITFHEKPNVALR